MFNRRILPELREAVREVGGDLVFLQEVEGGSRSVSSAEDHVPPVGQYEFLADQIWPDHAYGRNAVAKGQDHGNAVLSRLYVRHSHNHDLSVPGAEPRGLLHCILERDPGQCELHVMCVHLGLWGSHRRRQFQRICALVLEEVPSDAPLILAGDFNDWRSQSDTILGGCGLVEVFRHASGSHARTFPAHWPMLRLDRIYVRGVVSARPLPMPRQPWAKLSDHAPLAAEIELPGDR